MKQWMIVLVVILLLMLEAMVCSGSCSHVVRKLRHLFLSLCVILLLAPVALSVEATEQTAELTADTNVYAILYTDGTMVFQHGNTPEVGRNVSQIFQVDMVNGYYFTMTNGGSNSIPTAPWKDVLASIQKVDFADKIYPLSTAFWFYQCYKLKEITHIENLDTSNVTSMQCMFYGCQSLTTLDLTSFTTSNVTNMGGMFLFCNKLHTLNLSNFNTSKVEYMTTMFAYCSKLKMLDLSSFDTSKAHHMNMMFSDTTALKTVYVSEHFVTSKVSDSSNMFFDAKKLVGGNGTVFDSSHTDKAYARIDKAGAPGYFTDISAKSAYSVPKSAEPVPGDTEALRKAGEQKLNTLYQNFEAAYNTYAAKMKDILAELGQEKKDTDTDYEKQANKLMVADADTGFVSISAAGAGSLKEEVDKRAKLHTYMAVCQMLNETADAKGLDFSKIGFSDPLSAESKIVKQIRSSLSSYNKTFDYSGSEVTIRCLRAQLGSNKSAHFGSITVNERTPEGVFTYNALLCTSADEDEGNKLIAAYLNQMRDLMSNAVTNVYASLIQDLFGKSVSNLSADLINKKFTGTIKAKLTEHGLGTLADTMSNCYDYYKLCQDCTEVTVDGMTFKNMEKNAEKVQKFDFKTPASTSAAKKVASKLEQAERNFMNGLYELYTTGTIKDNSIGGKLQRGWDAVQRFFSAKCPISVEILDASGKQVGYVGDDDLRYEEDTLLIEENGDEKRIYFLTDDPVSVRITGTDYGSMNCTLEEYEDGTPTGRANFYDIALEAGKSFEASLVTADGVTNAEDLHLAQDGGDAISATEYLSVSSSAAVWIDAKVNSDGGGTVTGGGVYVKGDAVVLRATAADNHAFIGWYGDDDAYLSGDIAYTFTAREDTTVTAYFTENYPSLANYMVEVSEIYQDVYDIAVQQDGDAFTVHVTKLTDVAAGQNISVFLASYADNGKMMALASLPGKETPTGMDFTGNVSERGSKLFILDEDFRPIIDACVSE